jgi:hypothetical protein
MREAIEFCLDVMREDGLGIPEPQSSADFFEVSQGSAYEGKAPVIDLTEPNYESKFPLR